MLGPLIAVKEIRQQSLGSHTASNRTNLGTWRHAYSKTVIEHTILASRLDMDPVPGLALDGKHQATNQA